VASDQDECRTDGLGGGRDDRDYARPVNTPSVSVVISTQTREALVVRAVEVLLDDPATTEVVVVLDGGTDAIWERLGALASRHPRLQRVRTDHGDQLRTLQAGVEAARGEIVLLLDDDVTPSPRLVSGHAEHHAQRRDLVVLGYMPTTGSATDPVRAMTRRLYGRAYETACAQYEADAGQVLRRLWLGNVSLRRTDCLRVGLPSFIRGYNSDRELGFRLREAGLTGVFDRSLRAEHQYERSLSQTLADQEASGRNAVLLHRARPDDAPIDELLAVMARRERLLLSLARDERTRAAVVAVLAAGIHLAARARALRLTELLVHLAATIQRQRGMEAAGMPRML
jgi:glycosyltransferase involved in cell wall biosynthesis